jgi:23S rRNA (cytidine1920-2'-O)/16S rRNA (cytidine1409-2'-O)-methyltransferase
MDLSPRSARDGSVARPARASRDRLDILLVARGLAPSRERARAVIMAGLVRVDGRLVDKPGTLVPLTAACELVAPPAELRYASRGGLKLERALDTFGLNPAGRTCLDVGASTGGFTDVLLRRGAARVYAVDVGQGQLAWTLRTDARVVVMERTNVRYLTTLPEAVHCAAIDVSFISLRLVIPAVAALLAPDAWVVALIKPQFEAGRAEADRSGGVITDPAVHRAVLASLLAWLETWHSASAPRLVARGLAPSPISGREGNREYLLFLSAPSASDLAQAAAPAGAPATLQLEATVAAAFGTGEALRSEERAP